MKGLLTIDNLLNPLDTVVKHFVALVEFQVPFSVHVLTATSPLGPLGHNIVIVTPESVFGHTNVP